jgi:demethylspheroidene O-methyltransferase
MAAAWTSGLFRGLPQPLGKWRDRALEARDRLLTSERFRSSAAALPITRLVARRRARDLFDLCAGFVYSQALLACVEMRLFDRLADGPRSLAELAAATKLPLERCQRLLQAATALRLIERRSDDRYGLGPLGASLANNPSLTAMIEHHRHLYDDLRDPLSLLRGAPEATQLSNYWPYATADNPAGLTDTQVAEYSHLMSLSQPLVAEEVLDAYRIDRHRCLMDVGGGEGAFIARAAARASSLRFVLFDLPAVAARAVKALAAGGLSQRVRVETGNFFTDPLPAGADVITLVRVLLDHDDANVLRLLKSCRAALADGGTLLIAEPLAAPDRDRIGAAYFGMYLMAMGNGRPRSETELRRLLHEAGFTAIEIRRGQHVLGTGIVTARGI